MGMISGLEQVARAVGRCKFGGPEPPELGSCRRHPR